MRVLRLLAGALSLNRIGFGLAYLLAPGRAGRGWVGGVARDPATQVFTRGLGARDVALGAGALAALLRRDESAARKWLAGHALADGSDVVSTIVARDRLPERGFRLGLVIAGLSAGIATAGAAGLRPTDQGS